METKTVKYLGFFQKTPFYYLGFFHFPLIYLLGFFHFRIFAGTFTEDYGILRKEYR